MGSPAPASEDLELPLIGPEPLSVIYDLHLERECARPKCGKTFLARRKDQRYCSNLCARKDYTDRYDLPVSSGLSTGTIGAISELVVAADLMRRGFEVYRALSPASSCDLLAQPRGGSQLRIEVRTGYLSPATGRPIFPRNKRESEHLLDHYAIVLRDGVIVYDPPLSIMPQPWPASVK